MDKSDSTFIIKKREFDFIFSSFFSALTQRKTEKLGRYINDYIRFKNCKAAQFDYNGDPHLGIFATSDIKKGTELQYNYNRHELFWRSNVSICF